MLLPRAESHHATRVLRLRRGDAVVVSDGAGAVASGTAVDSEDGRLAIEIGPVRRRRRPHPEIACYQGAAKGHKVDEVIERLAQLGVAEVRAFESERSVVRWKKDRRGVLETRWAGVARAAAKQSRSPYVAATGPPLSWPDLIAAVAAERRALALWEEATVPLRRLLEPSARIALVVGPEGGLSADEVDELRRAGAHPVSLGERVLRTEDAAVVAAAAILYHFGAIG